MRGRSLHASVVVCLAVVLVLLVTAGCGSSGHQNHETTPETWDDVALGDSLPYGTGDVAGKSFVYYYARNIERDTGVSVRVHNLSTDGGTSDDLLSELRHDSKVRQALRGAEVITISIGGNDLDSRIGDFVSGTCGGPDNEKCLRAALVGFRRSWGAILANVLRLRDRRDTIIRVTNDYNPFPGNARAAANLGKSIGPVFTRYIRRLNAIRCSIAGRHRIPCADIARAFNGPNTDGNAFAKGLIGTDQYAHPSAKGHRLIAHTLRALGYRPLHS